MLAEHLLKILRCTKCRGELSYDSRKNTLTCKSCSRVYPVKDDIPIMLLDDGKKPS